MHSIILCFGVDVLSKLGRNMNNRIKSLDNTKWILTLLICLYHIQFMGDEKYSTLFYWVKDLGNCVVQVFSLISGFLFLEIYVIWLMCVIELCVTVSKKLCKWIHAISYLYFSRCHYECFTSGNK